MKNSTIAIIMALSVSLGAETDDQPKTYDKWIPPVTLGANYADLLKGRILREEKFPLDTRVYESRADGDFVFGDDFPVDSVRYYFDTAGILYGVDFSYNHVAVLRANVTNVLNALKTEMGNAQVKKLDGNKVLTATTGDTVVTAFVFGENHLVVTSRNTAITPLAPVP